MANWSNEAVASFLVDRYGISSQEALRKAERLVDLHKRGIAPEDAKMYLKSGGWDQSLAEVYKTFLNEPTKEKGNDMSDKQKAIPVDITQKLLAKLIMAHAEAAGFRACNENESLDEYNKALVTYIKAMRNAIESASSDEEADKSKQLLRAVRYKLEELAALLAAQ